MMITLVGSTRYAALFAVAMEALTLKGHTVMGLGYNSSHKEDGPGKGPTDDQKVMLDLVHLKKILESEAVVLITDASGYFGQSTQRELAWAMMLNKQVYLGHDGIGVEADLVTPERLRAEIAGRKAQREELHKRLRGGVMGLAIPGGGDEEEGSGRDKPN